MSTGLSIESALYGAGSSTVDVKSAVLKHIQDGSLQLTVSVDTLGITDPSPGQPKTLTVNYSINGGQTNTSSAKDGQVLKIDAPPVRYADGLIIEKAEYGYVGNWQDVTNAVQDLISNGSLNIKKLSHTSVGLPDPNPQKLKMLKLKYTLNGAPNSEEISDGESFSISAPPSEQTDTKPLKDHATSLIGALYSNALKFIGVFLQTLSVVSAYRFGSVFLSPWILGMVAFLIPFFSFWLLPMIIFGIRLFSSSDYATPLSSVPTPIEIPKNPLSL